MPWQQFLLLSERLAPVWAADQVHQLQAMAGAVALTMGKKDGPAVEEFKRLVRRAFPEAKE